MNCPSCNSSLEQNARFCGVCGYRLQAKPAAAPQQGSNAGGQPAPVAGRPGSTPQLRPGTPLPVKPGPLAAGTPKQPGRAKARPKGDEIYINQVLNNRFKVESKIGEGGFGAVYRGIQLPSMRKVALKLLHPEMTKDENLVARFSREGEVLCRLRDAHTITTYEFDRTPDGTLYIAMELLEGKSLHQLFHEQAPLEWKRMFKILTQMCSSLAEAHSQGIVHRDLKPENVYLETRPGNPEFVKILDFGIAKVMRGDTIDPQSPQLTATGQTLGTLEYMSPEQLMGKPLDGRSDVYALGVVSYEMITGRLPFPDAKGPAGLITAQLKQTPIPPSQANQKTSIPDAANRVILKCLEKDKNNRYADVTALAAALQEVVMQASAELQSQNSAAMSNPGYRPAPPEMLETRRGDPPAMKAPAIPAGPGMPMNHASTPAGSPMMQPQQRSAHPQAQMPQGMQGSGPNYGGMQPAYPSPPGTYPSPIPGTYPSPIPGTQGGGGSPPQAQLPLARTPGERSKAWVWWVVGLLAFGAAAGAVLAWLSAS